MPTIDIVSTSDPAQNEEAEPASSITALARHDLRNVAGLARDGWESRYVRLLVVLELLIGLAAAAAALAIRFGAAAGEPYNRDYVWATIPLPFAWLVSLTANRAFDTRYLFIGTEEYARVIRAGIALAAALAAISFAFDLRLARGYVIVAVPLATAASRLVRSLLRRWLRRAWARGRWLRRVILVGHEQVVRETNQQLRREGYHGMAVVGVCLPRVPVEDRRVPHRMPGLPPVYGTFAEVPHAAQRAHADTVIVLSCPELDGVALRRLAWRLEPDNIDLIVGNPLVDVAAERTTVRPADGLPLLHVEHPRLTGGERMAKEVIDRAGALAGLLLMLPLLLLVALLIKVTERARGPVIFRQVRVGRDGKPFVMYKFRTMYADAEARLAELRDHNETGGTLFKMRDDPRVTPLGRWLRKLSIDELPQLFNVLNGSMSLVGPRPPLPREVEKYPFDMRRRMVVKPGLTGLWQVSGRSDLSWEDSIRLDLQYVENWTLSMDLMILARTLLVVLGSAGAY